MDAASRRVAFANTLRGLAALAVLAYHYLGLFWVEDRTVATLTLARPLPKPPVPVLAAWIMNPGVPNLGAFGVGLFFLISGFVIPFSLERGSRAGFLVNRLLRIVPTYVIGLSLTLAALAWSAARFGMPWPYSAAAIAIHYVPGLRDLVDAPSIDGIIWTLECEIKFYLLCLLLQPWFRRRAFAPLRFALALGLVLLALDVTVPHWIGSERHLAQLGLIVLRSAPYQLILFAGVALHYRWVGALSRGATAAVITALVLLWWTHWTAGPTQLPASAHLGYALALALFAGAQARPHWFTARRLTDFLADISYPLYVIHGVAGYVAIRGLLDAGVPAPLAPLLVAAVAFGLAWMLHCAVERPTQRLGRRLARSLAPV